MNQAAVFGLLTLWGCVMLLGLSFCLSSALQDAADNDSKLRIRPMFATFDCWIGVFWDSKKRAWYWFPLPMLGLKITGTGEAH